MKVLVVDDEPAVADAVARALRLEGYDVSTVGEGLAALGELERGRPDALVLDVMMPRMDGLEVARELRARGDRLPILMLTARDSVGDRVAGLDAGADDYLVKPFALEELLARLRALLRRSSDVPETGPLQFGDLWLDPDTRLVRRGEREIETTRTEYLLLELFLRNPRRVLTRSTIFEAVWGYDFGYASNSLDVYIGYLRRKTEAGGRAAPDPHQARRRLRPPRVMSFRARLMLLVAAAVAVAVGVACLATYVVVRDRLTSDADATLASRVQGFQTLTHRGGPPGFFPRQPQGPLFADQGVFWQIVSTRGAGETTSGPYSVNRPRFEADVLPVAPEVVAATTQADRASSTTTRPRRASTCESPTPR